MCVCLEVCVLGGQLLSLQTRTCQTWTEQKKEQTNSGVMEDVWGGGGIAPEWDMTDSILTSRLAAGDVLVLTIPVLCPIIKPYFYFFFLT